MTGNVTLGGVDFPEKWQNLPVYRGLGFAAHPAYIMSPAGLHNKKDVLDSRSEPGMTEALEGGGLDFDPGEPPLAPMNRWGSSFYPASCGR